MSRHAPPESEGDKSQLVVPATMDCHARSITLPGDGAPRLLIDYGGYELAFDMHDPRVAEQFAVGLAFAALAFASNCRHAVTAERSEDPESGRR